MTDLSPLASQLALSFQAEDPSSVRVVADEARGLLAMEDAVGGVTFAEAEGDELRITPAIGNEAALRFHGWVRRLAPSSVEGLPEVVISLSELVSRADHRAVMTLLQAARDHWRDAAHTSSVEPASPAPPMAATTSSTIEAAIDPVLPDVVVDVAPFAAPVQLRADVSIQWSWASSAARIPQITDLSVTVVEPLDHVHISVLVRDGEIGYGSRIAHDGPLPAGTNTLASVHVPLSASQMSQVEERRAAQCLIQVRDAASDRLLAQLDEAIDIQPRDLWLWGGDPRRTEQRERVIRRGQELLAALDEDPDRHHRDVDKELGALSKQLTALDALARSLLAAFVRPNHGEVAVVAREAAEILGRDTGDPSFFAFQADPDTAAQRADATVDAVYEALRSRRISYSEPPPGWDYRTSGQRIRDHGEVARGGLGTCMDTTVLTAAVLEQVGLHPVLVLVPGHIFIGYWRYEPFLRDGNVADWFPDQPVVRDLPTIGRLLDGRRLGLIETTAFTTGTESTAVQAREEARLARLPDGLQKRDVTLIDVLAARRAGVSPLPAVQHRADGVIEVVEYRPGGERQITQVSPIESTTSSRAADGHPVRYRTWKSALFTLNATNDLLNLKRNARVQPLVLPPQALGVFEDRLNQDVSFTLRSGYDVPEVWRAREVANARQLLDPGPLQDHDELLRGVHERRVFVQRFGTSRGVTSAISPPVCVRELRSMAHQAKVARDERGMNPLFLCIGLLRWPYKDGVWAEAPLILVPVNLRVARGRQEITLSLDTSQQTTPNAALLEWLRHEHGLSIPGLAEPLTDHAGIDVDGVLAEVRRAVADRGLELDVTADARLALLDLSSFRMWQDLDRHADAFLERPLVRHLVDTPTDDFLDPVVGGAHEPGASAAPTASSEQLLDTLETPISADSTQKRAVLWAREGRTFVLQGPPGTGKSQTITNMVAECLLSGLRVLFVAEKGTALAVVQRRLESIGLGPFTLNLHHEGSNAAEVRAQLKRALSATVAPDTAAMENARRQVRAAHFELTRYPSQLHDANAAGLSAYAAHDQRLVLGEGPTMPVPQTLVAHHGDQVDGLRSLFGDLQSWTSAAGVRPDHPWRLAGRGAGDPVDVAVVTAAVDGVLAGLGWSTTTSGSLREALDGVEHPAQLDLLAAATDPGLPGGATLAQVLAADWTAAARHAVTTAEELVQTGAEKLRGFSPRVLDLDLTRLAGELRAAGDSGFMGRKKRIQAAIDPLTPHAPAGLELTATSTPVVLADLIDAQRSGQQARDVIAATPGLAQDAPREPYLPGALRPAQAHLQDLVRASAPLRSDSEWARQVTELAVRGVLDEQRDAITAYAAAWRRLWTGLAVDNDDFLTWRGSASLAGAIGRHEEAWRRDAGYERLMSLQRWCQLVRQLEPMRAAGLTEARVQILEGRMPAYTAEDALTRGIAESSLAERIGAVGMDRFDATSHDQRVTAYSSAQAGVRRQWVTDAPARLLARRGSGGKGAHTGGLARELEKTRGRLGTRPILRRYAEAVQELTPLVLGSPSSIVDLIEPGTVEFDLVIFDEASQITVPEAVGALGRAKAAIVVGDTLQMPPTRTVGRPPGDEESEDADAEEIVEDQESILSECELARVPTLSLSWHYRSQDEALIAFSNRAYYNGDLSSFPTPTLLSDRTGLEFRRVDGLYLRAGSERVQLTPDLAAGSNTNPVEALAIVREVERLVNQGDELPSLGVVTFNEPQRQLIEELLLISSDPRVGEVMDEHRMGRGDVLFVKALEQVQGDERDTVIFSIAFSKQANGKIPTNFGPLSNNGGERRLNVAVTRARRKNVVFCSFDPAELEVSNAAYRGPRDLKEFLLFAKASGETSLADDAGARVAIRDRHRDDVAAALREAGLHVMSDVGLSNFRLDLVLARPESPERPLLPVLLDGESWMRRPTVSDRDVLPVEVLEGLMGWPAVARIWWPMWLQNRDEVIAATLAAVERAEEAVGVPDPPLPSESEPPLEPAPATVASASDDVTFETVTHQAPPLDATPIEVSAGAHVAGTREDVPASEFRPARADVVGDRDVLDRLPERSAAAIVREQVLDVIAAEGPVEIGRLTRIVARRFGLGTVRTARAEAIAKLVPRAQTRQGRLGVFAWPPDLEPATWRGFRYADPDGSRTLQEVAPEEIANAMQAVLTEYRELSDDDVMRRTAELFGVSRLGANVRDRLDAVRRTVVARRLSQSDEK